MLHGWSWTQVRERTRDPDPPELTGTALLDLLYSLLSELTPLMHPRASPHTSLSLCFDVHWTRISSCPPRVPRTALPPGMYISPGRPDIFATLQNVIAGVRSA
jgi:hypothetical protein